MSHRIIFVIILFIFLPSCLYPLPPHRPSATDVITIKGINLKSLYRRLDLAGFNPGTYEEEDMFRLSESIRRFQILAKLKPDGILDQKTWERLQKLYDPGEDSKTEDTGIQGPIVLSGKNAGKYPIEINKRAFGIESVECSDISGDWIILYEGIVTQKHGNTVLLKLERRFGYRYHPDSEGIDDTNWWCIPRKRHCYCPVNFSSWDGIYFINQIVSFPVENIFNAKIGIINGISSFLKKKCNR